MGYTKEKMKAYQKDYYRKNKSKVVERVEEARRRNSSFVNEWKESRGCIVCGESDPCCLDMHHTDSKKKDSDLSALVYGQSPLSTIVLELEKCVVVCASCHRKIHAGRMNASVF